MAEGLETLDIQAIAWSRHGLFQRNSRIADGDYFAGSRWRHVLGPQQLLDTTDGVAFVVQQPVDRPRELDVCWAIVAAVARTLQRAQLRELRLPIAQDVLSNAELGRELADGPEGGRVLLPRRHP